MAIPNKWHRCRLADVADINPDSLGPDWPYEHIQYVDISSVGEGMLKESPHRLSLSEAPSRARRLVKAGDTVLSTVRPNRRSMFFVRETIPDLVVSTGFAVLRPRPGIIEPRFLYAIVFDRRFTAYLVSRQRGAAYPAVLPSDIAEAEILLPPLPEQRAIAHILGTLDDKIELNRRMNETLEAMAQALFKSWFVDFDPVVVNALKAGNPIPEKFAARAARYGRLAGRPDNALGLPEHILRLFPARFVDSALGPIPEGWEVKALDEIAHFQNGLALQKYRPKPGEGRLPAVKIAQLRSGRADSGEWASANIRPECIIDDGDVIFSWSGSLLLTIWCGGRAALNQHLFKVTSDNYPKWFYFHWIDQHLPEFIHIASGKATTMGHIKRRHLSEALCVVPGQSLMDKIHSQFERMLTKRIENELESRTLAELRDTLLPKLISGELRVPDVEKILEEAV